MANETSFGSDGAEAIFDGVIVAEHIQAIVRLTKKWDPEEGGLKSLLDEISDYWHSPLSDV